MLLGIPTQVLYKFGQETFKQLKGLGCNVEFKSYEGIGHTVSSEREGKVLALCKNRHPASSRELLPVTKSRHFLVVFIDKASS
jgi:hypothetical protein